MVFATLMVLLTAIGVQTNKHEHLLKLRSNMDLLPCELQYQGKPLLLLLTSAFLGGLISGALGLGGGSVFNPLMIAMGVPPTVSTSTGMYMIMLSSFASSVVYMSYDRLNLQYAIWLGFWTSLGILIGLRVVKDKRPSFIVFILAGVMGASAIVVPLLSPSEWEFTDICK